MSLAESALQAFARRLLRLGRKGDVNAILRAIAAQEPVMARLLRDGILNAYLRTAKGIAREALPRQAPWASASGPPLPPPFGPASPFAAPEPSPIRFPGIEAAADWLQSRSIFTPDDFRELAEEAQRAAFAVARSASLDAVGKVRQAVRRNFQEGGTLKEFHEEVADSLHESMLAPHRVEALYRTHTGQAQAAGKRAVLDHPLVADEFPYLLFSATHDERTRPDHLKMEHWGQNGTAVYRLDDPVWQTLWPPMSWNCRCDVIPLSIEDAAQHGSREAARWLRTGIAPSELDWCKRPYPVTPPPGWPTHQGIVAVV